MAVPKSTVPDLLFGLSRSCEWSSRVLYFCVCWPAACC